MSRTVELCGWEDCRDVAHARGLCRRHYYRVSLPPRTLAEPVAVGIAHDLSREEIAQIRAEVEERAIPLFVLALNWCATEALRKSLPREAAC
jgi:hypothetical protein